MSPRAGSHVRLRTSTLARVLQQYPGAQSEPLWRVETVNGGYGREALHLVAVADLTQPPAPDARRIVLWRGQVTGEPRCEYCSMEGHTGSSGTAANCTVRAAEVAEQRRTQSERMKAHWAKLKAEAEAEAMKVERADKVPF